MTKKRRVLTIEQITHICRRMGAFYINPLRWRSDALVRVLEKGRKDGILIRHRLKPGLHRYELKENNDGS